MHLFKGGGHAAVGVQIAVVGVLVVDGHQGAVRVIGEGEQAHAVIVVAELHFLVPGRAVTVGVERRACGVQWLTPADQYAGAIAGWQADTVSGGRLDTVKTQQRAGGGADAGSQGAAAQQAAAQKHGSTAQGAGADKATSTEADDLLKVGGLVFF